MEVGRKKVEAEGGRKKIEGIRKGRRGWGKKGCRGEGSRKGEEGRRKEERSKKREERSKKKEERREKREEGGR